MIEQLFPKHVVTVAATEEMWGGALHPEEEVYVRRAVAKRKREFTAGRLCARQALAQLGVKDFALRMGPDRAPIWPHDITGSISHCDGYCGAAVARQSDVLSIGLDVERADPLSNELLPLICTPAEMALLKRLPRVESMDWAQMIFSAKESTYKCYYPVAKVMLDFHDVQITLRPEAGGFTARLVSDSVPSVHGLRQLDGRFGRNRSHLFTGVALMAATATVP